MQANTASPGTSGGQREDLRDDITLLEPQETPYTSMVEKSSEASAMLVETMSDRMRAPRKTGAREGGPTGAGKTTMVKLLMRFYDVNTGAILVDGHNIRDLTRHDLRQMFGMDCPQSPLLIFDSGYVYGTLQPSGATASKYPYL
jgi:ABC-type transport system involved in cytochrome bd biosynthesis fused ATPase/permease subunit